MTTKSNNEYLESMKPLLRKEFGGDHFSDFFECPSCYRIAHKNDWGFKYRGVGKGGTIRYCPNCEMVEAMVIVAPEGCLVVDHGEILSR